LYMVSQPCHNNGAILRVRKEAFAVSGRTDRVGVMVRGAALVERFRVEAALWGAIET
jgi:hypothetical protein